MILIEDLKGKEIPFLITSCDRETQDFEAEYKTTINSISEMAFVLFQEDGDFWMNIRESEYCQGERKFYSHNEVIVVRKFVAIQEVVEFILNYLGR
jgi:hypothetical protein